MAIEPGGFDRLLVEETPGETIAVLMRGERPWRMAIDRPHAPDPTGAIVLGRVVARRPQMQAAFVDIGLPEPALIGLNGLDATEGASVTVEVVQPPREDKGARVRLGWRLVGRTAVLTRGKRGVRFSRSIRRDGPLDDVAHEIERWVPHGTGIVLRSAAASVAPDAVLAEARALADTATQVLAADGRVRTLVPAPDALTRLCREIGPGLHAVIDVCTQAPGTVPTALSARVRAIAGRLGDLPVDVRPASSGIGAEIDRGLADMVAVEQSLDGGGRLWIERTRALTAIDVDSGPMPPEALGHAAAGEIARHLRLRELGGMIVLDLPDGAAPSAGATLAPLLAEDETVTRIERVSRTPRVLVLLRERRGPGIAEQLARAEVRPASRALAALRGALRAVDGDARADTGLDLDAEAAALLGAGGALEAALQQTQALAGRPLSLKRRDLR